MCFSHLVYQVADQPAEEVLVQILSQELLAPKSLSDKVSKIVINVHCEQGKIRIIDMLCCWCKY